MVKLEAGERSELRMLLEFGNQKLIEAWTRKVYCRAILQHPGTNTTTAQSLRDVITSLANQLGCLWFRLERDGMEVENPLLNPNRNQNRNLDGDLDYNPTSSSFNLLDYAIHDDDNVSLSRELLVSRDYAPDEIATIILHKPHTASRLRFTRMDSIESLEFLKSWLCYRYRPTNESYSDNLLLALNASMPIPVPNTWREVVARRLAESNNLFEVVSMDVRMRKNVSAKQVGWLNWKNKSGMKELLVSIYFAAHSPKDFIKQRAAFDNTGSDSWISLSEETVAHCTSILTNLTATIPSPDLVPLVAHYV